MMDTEEPLDAAMRHLPFPHILNQTLRLMTPVVSLNQQYRVVLFLC
jgi:hypothetical protein